jgi:hypothetical protein
MVLVMTLPMCSDSLVILAGLRHMCFGTQRRRAGLSWFVPSGIGFGVQLRDLALRLSFDPGRLWNRLGGPERPMHRQQFFQQATQLGRLQRICSVGFGFLGIVVDFEEYTVDTRADGRARQ